MSPDRPAGLAPGEFLTLLASLAAATAFVLYAKRKRGVALVPRARRPVVLPAFEVPPDFPGAVAVLERLTGAGAGPLLDAADAPTPGRVCAARQELAEALLREAAPAFAARGFLLFRREQRFGMGDDLIALLATADQFEALRIVGTDGINADVTNEMLADWLRELGREQPLVLTGMGVDFVEGRFLAPVRDAGRLAERIHALCPDVVEQGTGTVAALARELRETGTLYLWWD